MEIFLTNQQEHFEPYIVLYKEYAGIHLQADTLLGVPGLVFPHQRIEIRAVAHTDYKAAALIDGKLTKQKEGLRPPIYFQFSI